MLYLQPTSKFNTVTKFEEGAQNTIESTEENKKAETASEDSTKDKDAKKLKDIFGDGNSIFSSGAIGLGFNLYEKIKGSNPIDDFNKKLEEIDRKKKEIVYSGALGHIGDMIDMLEEHEDDFSGLGAIGVGLEVADYIYENKEKLAKNGAFGLLPWLISNIKG